MEYAGSRGTKGTAPTVAGRDLLERLCLRPDRLGYRCRQGFAGESTYSIRFGPGRAFHGHFDHTSITYTARGRDIVIDGGYAAYNAGAYRTWAVSPSAHSVMTTPLSTYLNPVTKLTASSVKANAESYQFVDAPGSGISRVRSVLVLKGPDLMVTWDRASARTAQAFQTLWHLPPDQKATVISRTTAVAMAPGDTTKTVLFQIPFRQALPAGATLVKQAQTNPIQGWSLPEQLRPQVRPDPATRAVRQDGVHPVVRRTRPGFRFGQLHHPLVGYNVHHQPERRRPTRHHRHLGWWLAVPCRLARRARIVAFSKQHDPGKRAGGATSASPVLRLSVDGRGRQVDPAAGRVVQGRPVAVVDDGEVSACAVHHDPAAAAVKTLEQQTGRAGRALHPMRSGHAS